MVETAAFLKNEFFGRLINSNPTQIVGVSRLDLLKWYRQLDFKVGAEIGVAHAELAKLTCEINPQLKLYGVDAWAPYKGYTDYTRSSTFSAMEDQAMARMRPYIQRERFVPVKGFSMDVVSQFDDGSLDFVYIDANHADPYVSQDINEWSKKVRSGGIVAGHDYIRKHKVQWAVKDAIQRYTRENGIDPWFVLGADEVVPGVVREGARSWMFIKP